MTSVCPSAQHRADRPARPARTVTTRRLAAAALALALGGLAACSSGATADPPGPGDAATESPFDLTSAGVADRVRIDPVADAVAALEESGFEPVEPGKLTVATNAFTPPLAFAAEDDNETLLGADPDIAQLVADGLGLEYAPVSVAWADWPLGVESGKYDVVISNVTVTEERKDIFDFATYRNDVLSFAVPTSSDVESIDEAADVAGLTVYVGSGTNQEQILLGWIAENEDAGIEDPGEVVYYDNDSAARLAMLAGRIDAMLGPNAPHAYTSAVDGETKVVGTLSGGYPFDAEIAVGTAKGNGLVEPVSIVLNAAIADGSYGEVLARWAVEDEAVAESKVNPEGLPRP